MGRFNKKLIPESESKQRLKLTDGDHRPDVRTITSTVPVHLWLWVSEEAARRSIPVSWVITECVVLGKHKGEKPWF